MHNELSSTDFGSMNSGSVGCRASSKRGGWSCAPRAYRPACSEACRPVSGAMLQLRTKPTLHVVCLMHVASFHQSYGAI